MHKLPAPLCSIIIPCHNYAQWVGQAIESVKRQSLTNFECFIIDDSSSDNSPQVIREAIKGDARFHMHHVELRSLSATRNYGIAQGTAPFLCSLDADDEIGSPDYLEVMVSALEQDRTIGIAYSSIQLMDKDGNLGHISSWPPEKWDFDQQYNHINQVTSLCVFRREAWERAGGFRPYYRYAEDAEFWTTIGEIGYSAIHINAPYFHYRLHDKSASQVHRTGEIKEPDWLEFHPSVKDGQRPFAAMGKPPKGSWPVRFYNEPQVSIIIPVGKGHEELVKDALHSVEGQTERLWECIVVNDTGHDLDLMGFPWAKVVSTRGGIGAGAARNRGAKAAKAPFLVFLDADDMLKPDFLTATLKAYKQNGRYAYVDWLTHERMTNWQVHPTPEYSFEAIFEKPSIHPITCLIPKQWFNAVGGFDETLPSHEDVDLFMKLFTRGYCGVRVAQPLLIYNMNSGTRRKNGEAFETEFKTILKKRYGAFMEAHKMCDCIQPPHGLPRIAPTLDNAEQYRATYGKQVLAKLVGQFVAAAPVTFRGPATRVDYGRRAKGDVFMIWQADLENSGDTFEKVENYTTEPEVTVIPPPPEPVVMVQKPVEVVEAVIPTPTPQLKPQPKPQSKPRGKGKRK